MGHIGTLLGALGSFKLEIIPGFLLSVYDLPRLRTKLRRTFATPLILYGRWRSTLGDLVVDQYYVDAGLQIRKEAAPSKTDRQIINLQCLRNAVLSGAKGVVMEFGCHRGSTAIQMIRTMRSLGDQSKVYLLDSFQGMPVSAAAEDSAWQEGQLTAEYDEVVRRFAEFENVEVVRGFFSEVLPKLPNLSCKFAHVDSDLYVSTKDVNRWLLDHLAPGGVIIYDDYGFSSTVGVKKAVDEDLGGRSDFFRLYVPTGQYVCVKVG
jgi:O-methyltransferase